MPDTVLRMSGVTKRFRGATALKDVSLEVRRGEVHAICGENGAGKSTLMEILSGVHPHGTFDGTIMFDGRDMQFRSLADSEAEGIVIVHQELAVVPQLSIAENIFLGHEMTRFGLVDEERTYARAAELMARVGLHESPAMRMSELGIGKQQLVEIAKALAKDVRLLILDEPTAALGRDDSDRLMSLVDRFRSQGITCVLISTSCWRCWASPIGSPCCATARRSRRCIAMTSTRMSVGSSVPWWAGRSMISSHRANRISAKSCSASRTGPFTTRATLIGS